MDRRKSSHRGSAGFTLIEMLVGIAVLALIAVGVSGISLGFLIQTSDSARTRQAEATAAQWTSVKFARDVQGTTGVGPECAPGSGSRLVTLEQSGKAPTATKFRVHADQTVSSERSSIEYRVTRSGAAFGLIRIDCGQGGVTSQVASNLGHAPTISCDGAPCVEGTNPRVVTLRVARSSKFDFILDGTRRTTDGNIDPNTVPLEIPAFVSLGGKTMKLSGNGRLNVTGSTYLNKPSSGTAAFDMSGNVRFSSTGDLRIQQGSTWGGSGNSEVNPQPEAFSGAFPDPLRFLPAPATGGLVRRTDCPLQSGVRVCLPGIYGDGSNGKPFPPDASGNQEFRLEPGIYIVRSGMNPSGNVSITSSGGVLLYIEKGSVSISGNLKLSLSASASGIYAGVLFFQARTNTSPFDISGNGTWTSLNGAIYAPASSGMSLSSGNGNLQIPQLIGSSISISGNGEVTVGVD